MRNITRIRRSVRAISPVISVLLMIAIAVVASLVAYAWVMGYMGFQTSKVGQAIQIPSYTSGSQAEPTDKTLMRVYVQNVGDGQVEVGNIYINDELVVIISPTDLTIGQGATKEFVVQLDFEWSPGDEIEIKVVTESGTFMEKQGTGSSSSSPSQPALVITTVGSGGVSKDPDQASYAIGASVELTAAPAVGWNFAGWSGDVTGSDNPVTVVIDSNPQVTATFTQEEYSLTVTPNPIAGGTVNLNNNGPYHYGDVVTLTANPATGYSFSNWAGALTGSDNPDSLTITGNMVVTAEFSANPVTLTITPSTGGSIATDPAGPYHYDQQVQLTANPATGYVFTEWTGDLSGSTNPQTITLNGDKTVSATFTPIDYSITVTVDPSSAAGYVTPDTSGQTYHINDVVTLTPHANGGFTFDHWSGAGVDSGNNRVVTVTGNMEVTAYFTVVHLPIYVSSNNQVHDIPNVGSHSSFANMQNDGSYDTLYEANTGGAESWINPTSYSGTSWSNEPYAYDDNTGTRTQYDVHDDQWSDWLTLNYPSTTGTGLRYFVGREDSNINSMQIEVHNTANGQWQSVYSGAPTVDQWMNVTFGSRSTDQVRLRFYNTNSYHYRYAYVYEVDILSVAPINFQLDLEVQFSNVADYSVYTQLEIKTGHLMSENLAVYYWSGSSWQPITTALAEFTVNTYTVSLTGQTFDLRFIDTARTGDMTQHNWQIDYVRLVAP